MQGPEGRSMRETLEDVVGYMAPIRRSGVEDPLILGVPRPFGLCWIGICVMLFFYAPLSFFWALIFIGCLWGSVHGLVALGTRREPQWAELGPALLEPDEFEG